MQEVDPKEAARLVAEEGARLVDVREQNEWDQVHVPGAKLLPLSEYQTDTTMLAPARKTVFYCALGVRSVTAAEFYEGTWPGAETYSVSGGIVAWQAAGLPLESGS